VDIRKKVMEKRDFHVGSLVLLESGDLARVVGWNADGTLDVAGESRGVEWTDLEKIHECTRCGRRIVPGREEWLEHDTVTDLFHRPGGVPEGHESGGEFPFGKACSRKPNA